MYRWQAGYVDILLPALGAAAVGIISVGTYSAALATMTKYRADHVGSFLRPPDLAEAPRSLRAWSRPRGRRCSS